jgi:hypothetical protein
MAWKGDPKNPVPNFLQESSQVSSEKLDDVNRAEQVRRDTDTQKDFTVSLMDIDTAIKKHLDTLQLTVVDNGSRIKVPIEYANPEKWKSVQKDGVWRDYQGKIQLPVIVLKRGNSEKDPALVTFNRYLNYPVMKLYSQKNRYTQFNILMGQNVPVNEIFDVVMPDHMIFTYHFIVWTEYVEQMNLLIERLNFETEDYWGDLKGLRFRTKVDSFSHTIELQVDQDRMVKTEFDLMVYGYLLPDVLRKLQGNHPTTQKRFTPKKIVMGTTVVATDFDINNLDTDKEKRRNVNYPNIRSDTVIPTVPVAFTGLEQEIRVGTVALSIWTFPAPQNSSDPGVNGQISFDDDYYYIHSGGFWRRAPKTLVNAISTVIGEKKWLSFDNDYIYITGDLARIPMSLFNLF